MARYREPYTLYKRGKYWYYRTYSPAGLRTCGKSTGKKTKQEARQFCDGLYLRGQIYASNITFKEYAFHFFDDDSIYLTDRAIPLARNTINNYRKNLRLFLMPYFEKTKLCDINYIIIKEFRAKLYNDKISPAYIISIMNVLKIIIVSAYREDLISDNPFLKLEPIQVKQQNRDSFTLEEVSFLYKNIDAEFKNTILLMALTGMRISEAIGVTESDVIREGDIIYINLTKQFNNGEYKELKNKECRVIPITPEIVDLIGFNTLRLSAFYVRINKVKNNMADAKERGLSFHSLRHFFISQAKAYGVIESKVEFIAGHKLKGMASVYTNYKPVDLLDINNFQRDYYKKIIEG